MQKKIDKILEKAAADEKEELEILQVAVRDTRKAYQEGATERNKRNWDAARNGLNDLIDRLWEKYFNRQPAFKTRMEALKWLQEEGYKIKKSKLYKDADIGILPLQADGSVVASDVRAYAATLNKIKSRPGELDPDYKTKSKKESKKLDVQIQKMQFDLDRERGKYLLKSDVRTETAVKIAALEAGLKHFIAINAVDWIYAVGGRAEKRRVLINLFNAGLDELFNEFGNMEEIGIVIQKQDIANAEYASANS